MITGTVRGNEARVRLRIRDVHGAQHDVDAVIDTGYTSSLTLAPATIAMLGLPLRTRDMAILANGTIVTVDVYAGTVIWDGVDRDVLIHEFNAVPLVGMGLLRGYDLAIRVAPGGAVKVSAIP